MRRRSGFTLVETMVVISTIALLATLMLPAITRAKAKARVPACLANQRSLSQALAMYATDGADRLPPNCEAPFPDLPFTNWIAGHMGAVDLKGQRQIMLSPSRSLFLRYVPSAEPYACTARSLLKPRTLALSSRINPTPLILTNMWQWTPLPEGAFRTTGDFRRPGNTFTFIEESAQSVGDAYFAVDHSGTGEPYATSAGGKSFLADVPGASHSGATVISFADGHSESHLWQSEDLRGDRLSQRSLPRNADRDVRWLREASLGAN